MSTITALAHDGRVYMASDQQSSQGDRIWPASVTKIRKVETSREGDLLIGVAGAGLASEAVVYQWEPGEMPRSDVDDGTWIRSVVVRDLYRLLEGARCFHREGNRVGELMGEILLAFAGTVYHIDPDFCCIPAVRGYASIGSGGEFADGALFALQHVPFSDRDVLSPAKILGTALRAACEHDLHSALPMDTLEA